MDSKDKEQLTARLIPVWLFDGATVTGVDELTQPADSVRQAPDGDSVVERSTEVTPKAVDNRFGQRAQFHFDRLGPDSSTSVESTAACVESETSVNGRKLVERRSMRSKQSPTGGGCCHHQVRFS